MSGIKQIDLKASGDGVMIRGSMFSEVDNNGDSQWEIEPLDKNRLILFRKNSQEMFGPCKKDFARTSVAHLESVLKGLASNAFTGSFLVDTGRGTKKFFLEDGELVFASSNLIDDRLGEVIYRKKMINMEQLTDAAVKVSRTQKFGQVLLKGGIFEPLDLWEGLKYQVKEVFDSIFLGNQVFYQIIDNDTPPPTRVRFSEETMLMIDSAASYGRRFRAFLSRIMSDSPVSILDREGQWNEPASGTYEADFLEILRGVSTVEELIGASKLTDINTYRLLYDFSNHGICQVGSTLAPQMEISKSFSPIKGRLDAYLLLLKFAKEAFLAQNVSFPVDQLIKFIHAAKVPEAKALRLDSEGAIVTDAVEGLYSAASGSPVITGRVTLLLESLICFLLQMVSDLLPWESSKKVKSAFQELVA